MKTPIITVIDAHQLFLFSKEERIDELFYENLARIYYYSVLTIEHDLSLLLFGPQAEKNGTTQFSLIIQAILVPSLRPQEENRESFSVTEFLLCGMC